MFEVFTFGGYVLLSDVEQLLHAEKNRLKCYCSVVRGALFCGLHYRFEKDVDRRSNLSVNILSRDVSVNILSRDVLNLCDSCQEMFSCL